MALDTLDSLIGKVQQRVGTLPDFFFLQDILVNKYRDLQSRLNWTWRRKRAAFLFYAPVTTGTVSVTRGYNIATFSDAIITADLVGRQLRVAGNNTAIMTITDMLDSTHAVLDRNWTAASVTALGFEIYQAYVTVPSDFSAFISIVDLQRNFQLDWWSHTAEELDRTDPRRSYGGSIAYWMVLRDYNSDRQGVVYPVLQALGTGNSPISGGTYTGADDALFTIEITGAATFKWKKGAGSYTTGVAMDPVGDPQPLQDGVEITFPVVAYTVGNVFMIRCDAADSPGEPRYEAWPHIKVDEERPYLYKADLPDLTVPGTVLPRFVRGDALVEGALADIAMWKNEDNKYYDLKLAGVHMGRAEEIIAQMEREDQARESTDLIYTDWTQLPVYDSGYLAGHDIGYELNVLD